MPHEEYQDITVGAIVRTTYRTGEYIGEIVNLAQSKVTVKTLAVLRHPTQGDLHNPFQANVPMFHQRRALAYQEKINVPLATVIFYTGDVPDYPSSLTQALDHQIAELRQKSGDWAERSIYELEQLRADYFRSF